MRKRLSLLITILGTVLLCSCGGGPKIEIQSHWSDSAVIMNGSADDWAGFPIEYSEEEKISLGVRNDAENIYLVFSARDEGLVRKIHMGGLTLWFDTTGGKKKDFGIRYRGSVGSMENLQNRRGFLESIPPEEKARFEQMQSEMLGIITVIRKGEETSVPENNPKGLAAASASQQGIFSYEFRVPIVTNDSISYAISSFPGEEINMGLEIAGISREDREKMMRERPEMGGPPGGGGMPGGGPPRGRPEGRFGGDRGQMSDKQEIWIRIHLAQNPHSETENQD